uniref:DUF1758 domain-containing protein n=1 Tax=Caenorhabditis tropicalis TaxID=1561998 RepID=A0A1I7TI77_9PELO
MPKRSAKPSLGSYNASRTKQQEHSLDQHTHQVANFATKHTILGNALHSPQRKRWNWRYKKDYASSAFNDKITTKNCYSSYTIHHQSICEAREPHTKPENKVNNDREINNKEDDTNESLSLEERLTNL